MISPKNSGLRRCSAPPSSICGFCRSYRQFLPASCFVRRVDVKALYTIVPSVWSRGSELSLCSEQCQVEQVINFMVLNMRWAGKTLVTCLHSAKEHLTYASELMKGISWGWSVKNFEMKPGNFPLHILSRCVGGVWVIILSPLQGDIVDYCIGLSYPAAGLLRLHWARYDNPTVIKRNSNFPHI